MMQLHKLHKQFARPPAVRLHDLLKIFGLQGVASKTLVKQEYIVTAREPYKKIRNSLQRYRVIMGAEKFRSNNKIYRDFCT